MGYCTNCLTILFEFNKNFKITLFLLQKWQKNKTKLGCCSGFFPPMVLFCIETVLKAGHWPLKYNYSSKGRGLFTAKTLDFESTIEVRTELGSLYKMDQL